MIKSLPVLFNFLIDNVFVGDYNLPVKKERIKG